MASFDSALYTSQVGAAGVSPAVGRLEGKYSLPETSFIPIMYTVDGAEDSGDTINLGKLPEGVIVIPSACKVVSDTGFDVSDMDIGVSGNINKYADAVDTLDTASDVTFSGGDNHYSMTEVAAGGEDLIATLTTVVTSTADSVVVFLIAVAKN